MIARLSLLALVLASAGCALEVQNRQPAEELRAESAPPGSVYAGWRVFQDRCARCHGVDATGGQGPDLTQRMRGIGPRRFVGLVLERYDWNLPADAATVDAVTERRAGAIEMPAWHGEPRVEVHIADLYAWLAARAEGTVGPGRP
jgi:mono/diheme cytochrome c family protein